MDTRCALIVSTLLLSFSGSAAGQSFEPSEFFVHTGADSLWVGMYQPPEDGAGGPPLLLLPGFPAVTTDVLGLGRSLSARGSHVFVLQPRGHGRSSGWATFANALEDVDAVLDWIRASGVLPSDLGGEVVLGGHSWGGGIALAYAAEHPVVRRVVAIAASDHGVFIRRVDGDPEYGALYREALRSLEAPAGPVRFSVEADLAELRSDWARHDLATIAPRLADRDLLLIVGWDDEQVEIEHQVVPFYRALKRAGAEGVHIVGLQDGHSFRSVRARLSATVQDWLVRKPQE